MSRPSLSDFLCLSVEERIRFAQALWDSIATFPEAIVLSETERKELDIRLEAHNRDPRAVSSWPDVLKRLRKLG